MVLPAISYKSIPVSSRMPRFNARIAITGEKSIPPMGGMSLRNRLKVGPADLIENLGDIGHQTAARMGIHVSRQ